MTDAWQPPPEHCETLEYENPDGDSIRWRTLIGVTGRMMPPIAVSTVPIPAGHGSRYLASAHTERVVAVPLVTPGVLTDRDELRRWAKVLDPAVGEGTLTVVQGEWAGRRLICVYEAGLDEMEELRADYNRATLLFRAAWPYWEDATEQTVTVSQSDTVVLWFPFLPLVLGESDTLGETTLTNGGDVPAWPLITVTGPAEEVTVTNHTTGAFWHVTGDVAAGEVLVVDHRPGRKQASVDGVSVFGRLTADSSLWPLVPGVNLVEMAGALTTAATSIEFTWRPLWLSA